MNTLAQVGQYQLFSFHSYSQNSAKVEPLTADQGLDKARPRAQLHVQASQSTSVSIGANTHTSYTYLSSGLPEKNNAVDKSQAVAQSAAAANPAADNILSFISQRIATDIEEGATQEEIATRLQAAYDGFVKGFGEAFDELSAAGLLAPEIEQAIKQTYSAVVDGIARLAEKYGVESPVVEESTEPTAAQAMATVAQSTAMQTSQQQTLTSKTNTSNVFANFADSLVRPGEELKTLLESTQVSYEAFAKRDFSFELKTQDGDVVKIKASASYAEQARVGNSSFNHGYAAYGVSDINATNAASSQFAIGVDGELDEDELRAINDLLSQVSDLSETFYSGNIEEAFQMALDVGFDESEIARFSLNLRQEVSSKIETSYGAVQKMPAFDSAAAQERVFNKDDYRFTPGNLSTARMQHFVEMLTETKMFAENIGVKKSDLPAMGEFVSLTQGKDESEVNKFSRFMEKLLAAD